MEVVPRRAFVPFYFVINIFKMYTELDSYAPNGSTYDDFYCGSEDRRSDLSRSPLGVNINAYPMTTIEFEPIPNVFSFPPCTPTIK